jgi:hypothetical protein
LNIRGIYPVGREVDYDSLLAARHPLKHLDNANNFVLCRAKLSVYLRLLWFELVNDVMPEQAGAGSAGSTLKCWKDTALDFKALAFILTHMRTLWNSNGMVATHSNSVGLLIIPSEATWT